MIGCMGGSYVFQTPRGRFAIVPERDGFNVLFEDEVLGWYGAPEQALDDLVGGHTYLPSNGVDPSTLGLPDELSEWTFMSSG
jgi:hypothetical protein